jgi:choline-sulfatase
MNVLVIMSDEHSNQVMGCSGHSIVETPVLDRLASEGAIFTNCYTSCPVCTPARASFITGQYVNKLGTWDNATPYDGKVKGVFQHLYEHGEELVSFGKLDFHPEGEYAGLQAHLPRYRKFVQLESCFRGEDISIGLENRYKQMGIKKNADFDAEVRDSVMDWLTMKSKQDCPWVLYVGLNDPHFPFFVDEERWNYYNERVQEIPAMAKGPFSELNEPLQELRRHFRGDAADEETVRKAHVGYYALTSRLDDNIGMTLDELREQGLEDDTLIIYTSDHGEQLGHHGLWWKCCMYEESSNVPLIIKGPGIAKGICINEPVSLIDIFPTICEARGILAPPDIPGKSLLKLAKGQKR